MLQGLASVVASSSGDVADLIVTKGFHWIQS